MSERSTVSTPEIQVGIGMAFHATQSGFLPDGYYRVCFLDKTYGLIYLKRLPVHLRGEEGPSSTQRKVREAHIRCLQAHILQRMLQSKCALPISDIVVDQRLSEREDLGERQKEIYDQRIPILKAMLEPLQFSSLMGQNFLQTAKVLGERFQVSPTQVKRLFHRLLEAGLDIHSAAITGHKRCGKRSNVQHEKKQGRTRRHVKNGRAIDLAGVNTNKVHIENIDIFIQTIFQPEKSRMENFRSFKSKYSVQGHRIEADGRVIREMLPEHQFSTVDQFGYHLKKRLEVLRNQLSEKKIKILKAQVKRKALGTARQGIPYPGHTLIIDSTVADVWLVSAWDRSKLIGRPVIYIVIDAFSSTVVGIHISLFNPSAAEAKIALFRALTDKHDFLKRYGLEKHHALLPTSPIPWELVFDRAELLSVEGKAVGKDLEINIGVPPAYFPEWKAIVERHFGILNTTAIHWLPGSTLGKQRERGEKDVRLDAVLTIHEFTKIVLRGAFQWNLRGTPTALLRPDQVVETGSASPIDTFTWGLENLHGTPRYLDYEKAVSTLLPSNRYSISDRGIKTQSFQWVAEWMNESSQFRKNLLDRPAKLFRSPDDPTIAFVKLQTEQVLRKANLSARFPVEQDYTSFDVDDMVVWIQDSQSIHRERTVGYETASDHETFEIVKQAQRATAFANDRTVRSKAEKTGKVSENRRAEINANAVLEVVDKHSMIASSATQTHPESSYTDPDYLEASDGWGDE